MKNKIILALLFSTFLFASISATAGTAGVADSRINLEGFDTIAFIMISIVGVVIIFGLIYIFIDAIKEVAPGIKKFLNW